ncbi:glycosyltransferase family 4 protein [Lysobacter sp. KIS68-7]|uniref:glycosyltransferase family 4 protein n=1 Tax=Lysobacter sp. KIS68-7 TaxID=2904252 RepID=UPI001E640353|nr:glycosyltransferase family 4 protein [Lysobacter sp. KIS68-7]UHQ19922.1 glycosyltransferase family 4 protein [Lysobacter sp. KIS68-7]
MPTALAALGHEVSVTLCSHRALPSERFQREGVDWASEDVRTRGPRFLAAVDARAKAFRPDWVVGCSDAWYGPLARRLAARHGARLAVDAYDNFEAYMPWNVPLHWRWRRAVRAADLVTAAGPQLAACLDAHRRGRRPTQIVPMAADPAFVPHDGVAARSALGLPADAPLIGYSGGWASNRGTDVLLKAFRLVRAKRPDARLVLTGKPPAHALAEPGVLSLGDLPDAQLPMALSALDVACVITADTAFGRYSYPAKLCEAMACEVPVVAMGTAPVRWMLHDDERRIAPIGDARAIADRLLCDLRGQRVSYRDLPTWDDSARRFDAALAGS